MYQKIYELYELTEEVVQLLDSNMNDKLPFYGDYERIQSLFNKRRYKNFFYMSKSAKEIIKHANPKFENSKIYQSAHFGGSAYKINVNGNERTIGSSYLERAS